VTILLVPPPGDPLGLLAPSVGGGTVPPAYLVPLISGRHWMLAAALLDDHGGLRPARLFDPRSLVLQTADGPDPIGMARAREVLARVDGLDPSSGVCWRLVCKEGVHEDVTGWRMETAADPPVRYWPDASAGGSAERTIPALVGVTDPPLALAHVLAARAGCEVVILEVPGAP